MTMYVLRNQRLWGAMAVGAGLLALGVLAWQAEPPRPRHACNCHMHAADPPRRWQVICASQLKEVGAKVTFQRSGEHALVVATLDDYTTRVIDRIDNVDDSAWETVSANDELIVQARHEGDRTARLMEIPNGPRVTLLRAALDTCLETDQ